MSSIVTCPQCQARIEVPGDMAEQPIRCHQCLTIFERNGKTPASVGIQAGAAPILPAGPKLEAEPAPRRSPSHEEARAPFPFVPLLIILLGLVFFLLVLSVGFNVWVVLTPENPFRIDNQLRRAEQQAMEQRRQAELAAQQAQVLQQEALRNDKLLQRRLDDVRRELEATKEELDEAKRRLEKLAEKKSP